MIRNLTLYLPLLNRMLGKALNEALGSLRRVAEYSTSPPKEPLEPVRESPPQNNIKQVAVAPRTPNTTGGVLAGHSVPVAMALCSLPRMCASSKVN